MMNAKWPILVPLTLVLVVSGCGDSGPKVIKSNNGNMALTVYDGMTSRTNLHEDADIQVANEFRELYVLVLSEKKSDFPPGTDLEAFDNAVRG